MQACVVIHFQLFEVGVDTNGCSVWAVDVGQAYLALMSLPDFRKVTVPFYFCISVEWALLRFTSLLTFCAFSLRDFSHSPSSESSFANIFSWCVTFLLILMTLSFSGKKLLISEILADSFSLLAHAKVIEFSIVIFFCCHIITAY